MRRISNLKEYFQEGHDAGHIFQHEDYEFVEEHWGFFHVPTNITVWADVLDLRRGSDERGEVYFHYTSQLAYLNITNESKEAVELWASPNTDEEEGKSRNAYWGRGIYTVPKSPDEWAAPPERPDWSPVQTLLDNYRSMMARDMEVRGADYVKKEYPRRAQFCIPLLVNSWMAYDVSIQRTPEMVLREKPVGVNLADKLLNEEGKPHRVCVVIRNQAEEDREPQSPSRTRRLDVRSPSRSRYRRVRSTELHARGDLLSRVKARMSALEKCTEEEGYLVALVRAQYRLAKVYCDHGQKRKAKRLFEQVVEYRMRHLGVHLGARQSTAP